MSCLQIFTVSPHTIHRILLMLFLFSSVESQALLYVYYDSSRQVPGCSNYRYFFINAMLKHKYTFDCAPRSGKSLKVIEFPLVQFQRAFSAIRLVSPSLPFQSSYLTQVCFLFPSSKKILSCLTFPYWLSFEMTSGR